MSLTRNAGSIIAGAVMVATAAASPDDPLNVYPLVTPSQIGKHNTSSIPAGCQAPKTDELTLLDVIDSALCNNPQTHDVWAAARAQAAQVGIAQASFLPSVSATGSIAHHSTAGSSTTSRDSAYNQESVGISLGYLLYDFGARDATLESARQVLIAANANQEATLQSVLFNAVQAYYQIFATRSALTAAQEAERVAQASLDAATARYKAGTSTPTDALQTRTAHSQAVLTRIRAEGATHAATGTLSNTIGLDANQSVTLAQPNEQISAADFAANLNDLLDELINTARQQRPELAAAEAQLQAATATVKATAAADKPTISLGTGLTESFTDERHPARDANIGVSIAIPLFSGYNAAYKIKAAQEQVALRAAQRDRIRQQISLDVWQAYYNIITEAQAMRSSEDLVASAEQAEKMTSGRYRAGLGNILDLLTAQAALASARQQAIQARYNWLIARAAMAQALGRLDVGSFASTSDPRGQPSK